MEFPNKNWDVQKINSTEISFRKRVIGRSRTARTEENNNQVENLILLQEDNPG